MIDDRQVAGWDLFIVISFGWGGGKREGRFPKTFCLKPQIDEGTFKNMVAHEISDLFDANTPSKESHRKRVPKTVKG